MTAPLIAFDARQVRPGMTGVGRRAGHLMREMIGRDAEFCWGLITNTPKFLTEWLGGVLPDHVEIWPVKARPDSHPMGDLWLGRSLPKLLVQRGAALLHGPAFQIPGKRMSIPCALTIHDLAHLERPFTQPWRFRKFLSWSIERGSRAAARIIVPSANVARDLATLHPDCAEKIHVVPGGIPSDLSPASPNEIAAVRAKWKLPARFAAHVGTFEPRKNHHFLLEIHTALCAEMDDAPDLVLAGQGGPQMSAVQRWRAQSPWRQKTHIVEGADDAEVRALLSGATAFLFPSLSEGFGLPVLEAMACGVPALLSEVPGMFHFAKSPARLYPLRNPRPWVEALMALAGDSGLREAIGSESRQWATQWTWVSAADQLLDLYRGMIR